MGVWICRAQTVWTGKQGRGVCRQRSSRIRKGKFSSRIKFPYSEVLDFVCAEESNEQKLQNSLGKREKMTSTFKETRPAGKIYVCICVCVCMYVCECECECVQRESESERDK